MEAAAAIAVAATGTIPQLGFIHEDSGQSFILDIADLFRDSLTVPCAFKAARLPRSVWVKSIERMTRRTVGERLRRDSVIPAMIDRIKALFTGRGARLMPMTVAVTRDVARPLSRLSGLGDARDRTGYFRLGRAVARSAGTALEVMSDWWDGMPGGSIVLAWKDDAAPGRLGLLTLGLPPRTLADLDGVLLVHRT